MSSPSSERAISRVESRWRSSALTEDLGFDAAPGRANREGRRIGVRRAFLRRGDERGGGEQNAADRGKSGIAQHLLEIVDEVGAADQRNAAELVGARALEEYVLRSQRIAVGPEESVPRHPVQRSRAQVDPLRVEMAELGLVT